MRKAQAQFRCGDVVDIGGSLDNRGEGPRVTARYKLVEEPQGAYAKVTRVDDEGHYLEPGHNHIVYMGRWMTAVQ